MKYHFNTHTVDVDELIVLAREAGVAIQDVYNSGVIEHTYKDDQSPVTRADRRSHEIISLGLNRRWPSIPVISEEQHDVPLISRVAWQHFWLVDPLDGTKEFIKGNGEYTVNIALIENEAPVVGVIYAPNTDELYYAVRGKGAYRVISDGHDERLRAISPGSGERLTIITSRSHKGPEVCAYISEMEARGYRVEELAMGSSLKFCRIAEGRAHIYPRYGTTMEWDIAAGQLIVEEAGGEVRDLRTQSRPIFNKKTFRNNSVIASCIECGVTSIITN